MAPSPWTLGGLSLPELSRRVWRELGRDEIADRAAALGYYFLFALFPALLFLTSLLGMLPLTGLMDRLIAYADRALPADAARIVGRTLEEIQAGARGGLLSFGVLAALWAGSNGMASVMTALNAAFGVEDTRPWWKRRLLSIVLTFGFALFIIVALVLVVFGPRIGETVADRLGLGTLFALAWSVLNLPVVVFFVLLGIALVYYFAPAAPHHWRWVTPGSVVGLALWLGMSYGLRFYVATFADYGATYGSIGGVILLMLWLYLSGFVLLVGAEINAEIEHAVAERGAVIARATGQRAMPVDAVAEPAAVIDNNISVAGRTIERWVAQARGRGWAPLALLGLGMTTGWLLRRRRASALVTMGGLLAGTALEVAGAIAAVERFRRPRTEPEARDQAIQRRAA